MCDIKNLRDLMSPHIKPDEEYKGYIAKRLTAPGDNYGSIILGVEVKIKNKNGAIRTMNLVAKKIPKSEDLQKIFEVQSSFKKEIQVYENVIPEIRDFQKEQDKKDASDIFPKYYAGRLNRSGETNTVNEDGVILLENLKVQNYKSLHRSSGLNLGTAKYLLKELAIFHAVPIALKLKEPKRFKDKILPVISKYDIFAKIEDKANEESFDRIYDIIEEDPVCAEHIDRVKNAFNNYSCEKIQEPFATISHNDFWKNNTMLRVFQGKPISSKFLDFQTVDYGSPGKDIIFFIFSSIQSHLVEEHFDGLIKTYFNEFIWTLRELNCDITPFTFEAFEKELELSAKHTELCHLLFMYQQINKGVRKVEELKSFGNIENLNKTQKEKIWFIIQQFVKRNWI